MVSLTPPVVRVNWRKSWGIQVFLDVDGKWDNALKALSQGFGKENTHPSMMPQYKAWGLDGHNGLDIVTINGDPLIASHDGVVMWEGADSSGGIGIELWDSVEQAKTLYWHNLSNVVKQGQVVKRGELLAYTDSTGFSTGTHIHWGLKFTDKYGNTLNHSNGYRGAIDPTPYLIDVNMKLKLVSIKGEENVWAIGEDNKRHLVINYNTYQKGIEIGLWEDSADNVDDLDEWAEGSVIILVKSK